MLLDICVNIISAAPDYVDDKDDVWEQRLEGTCCCFAMIGMIFGMIGMIFGMIGIMFGMMFWMIGMLFGMIGMMFGNRETR